MNEWQIARQMDKDKRQKTKDIDALKKDHKKNWNEGKTHGITLHQALQAFVQQIYWYSYCHLERKKRMQSNISM